MMGMGMMMAGPRLRKKLRSKKSREMDSEP